MNMYFLLTLFYWQFPPPPQNPPKVCTRSLNFKKKMQKLLRLGGGIPPSQTLPPLGRFAPWSLAFSLEYRKSCPPTKKFLRTALEAWIPHPTPSPSVVSHTGIPKELPSLPPPPPPPPCEEKMHCPNIIFDFSGNDEKFGQNLLCPPKKKTEMVPYAYAHFVP